jgi:hypothetical protein
MEIIWEISLQAIEILTLIFGILGITVSLMLLFSPNLAKTLIAILNRNVNLDSKIFYVDKEIQIDTLVYNHHVLMGALLIVGSVFALFFFFFKLDIDSFVNVFLGQQKHVLIGEIVFYSIAWVGKIACSVGLIIGAMLMLAPNKMKQLDKKLNIWFETKPLIEKISKPSHELDTFFFRHPIPFGLFGAVISFFIIALSLMNLLK